VEIARSKSGVSCSGVDGQSDAVRAATNDVIHHDGSGQDNVGLVILDAIHSKVDVQWVVSRLDNVLLHGVARHSCEDL
jgi:hypothetical protein